MRFDGRDYPLKIFPESEQRRLRLALGVPSITPRLQRQLVFYRQQLQRLNALERAGVTPRESAAKEREKIQRAWRRDLSHDSSLSAAEKALLADQL